MGIECSPEAACRTNSQVDVDALRPMMTGRLDPQGVEESVCLPSRLRLGG